MVVFQNFFLFVVTRLIGGVKVEVIQHSFSIIIVVNKYRKNIPYPMQQNLRKVFAVYS